MNQLGPIFKEKREKEGKSIDDAVRETKIAKKYLMAIENENFDIFPGETYLIGFIRNYAQFLGLDPDEMVQRYKSYKIQEQPTPIEQLTARPRRYKYFIFLIIIVIIVIGSIIAYIKVNGKKIRVAKKEVKEEQIKGRKSAGTTQKGQKESSVNKVVMEEEELIRNFKKGDDIIIPVKGKKYNITIDNIDNNLDFTLENIPFTIDKDEIIEVDFDKDGRKDILIKVNTLNNGIANLTIKRIYRSQVSDNLLPEIGKKVSPGSEKFPDVVIYKESELKRIPLTPKEGFVILTGYSKGDIDVLIEAKNLCYVGYYIDENSKVDKLLNVGDKINIKGKDKVILTLANAQAVDITVNNVSLKNLLKQKVITAKEIRWYRNRDNKDMYDLVIRDIKSIN